MFSILKRLLFGALFANNDHTKERYNIVIWAIRSYNTQHRGPLP